MNSTEQMVAKAIQEASETIDSLLDYIGESNAISMVGALEACLSARALMNRLGTAYAALTVVPWVGPEDVKFQLRTARLLAELHGESVLSEQQCAKHMRIDLVSWRKLERCFSVGTSMCEGDTFDLPEEDSETVLRAALAQGGAA